VQTEEEKEMDGPPFQIPDYATGAICEYSGGTFSNIYTVRRTRFHQWL